MIMDTSVNKIIVVGGGTAGLLSALILKKTYNVDIEIIKSEEIGIIGVGEGSTEQWQDFLDYCEIDWKELIKETDATVKLGIYFTGGWSKHNYYHSIQRGFSDIKLGQLNFSYLCLLANKVDQIKTADYLAIENLVKNDLNKSPSKQYHFNTFKLNKYLLKKCEQRGIKITNDTIKTVRLNDLGRIDKLIGEKDYTADFYIDCTGFKRLLISSVGGKWESYSKQFPMNEAIAFPTQDTNEYTPYTESRKTNNGWTWRIPTYGRWGNGHVYNNNLKNADQAKKESEEILGHEIEIGKHVKFDPGALEKMWIQNCLAVGLCASFIEPLEATSIGTTIQQIFLFNQYFIDPSPASRKRYNDKMSIVMNNLKEFVLIHYLNEKDVTLPDELQDKLKIWKTRPPIGEDFLGCSYSLFYTENYTQVLYGMDFWNSDEIKKLLLKFDRNALKILTKTTENIVNNYLDEKRNYISHKRWIENIRNT